MDEGVIEKASGRATHVLLGCDYFDTVNEGVYGQAKRGQVGGVVAGALLGLALVGIFSE